MEIALNYLHMPKRNIEKARSQKTASGMPKAKARGAW